MSKKVLIADDVDGIRSLVEATLGQDGTTEFFSARDGEEALQIAQQVVPDLIFLDVVMPKTDGYQVCKHLKKNPTTANIKVVMLTRLSHNADQHMALSEIGADAYLAKPFTSEGLLQKFEEVMVGA